MLRWPDGHHQAVRTRRNSAPPADPANDQDRHLIIPSPPLNSRYQSPSCWFSPRRSQARTYPPNSHTASRRSRKRLSRSPAMRSRRAPLSKRVLSSRRALCSRQAPRTPKCQEATKSYSARARRQGRASAHAGRGRATLISRRRDGRAARARTQIPGLRQSAALSAVQRGHQYRRARRLA
jgi:hypothetical protein